VTIRKAIFPVAGLGTRFLPATKSIPKEILTLVDRPLIDYAVEEARKAGIEDFIFVTSRGKSALSDYFDDAPELEARLEAAGKFPKRVQIGPNRVGGLRMKCWIGCKSGLIAENHRGGRVCATRSPQSYV